MVADRVDRRRTVLLENKVAIVVGGGQTPGETIGNGRATAITFAREGASVWVADRSIESARETVAMIEQGGGRARAGWVDVTDEPSVVRMIADCHAAFGRIDVLHNNVGVSLTGGDASIEEITTQAFDAVTSINLRGMVLTCKYVLPIMRAQRGGVIINISSMAAWSSYPYVAYKTSKAGVIALTEQIAQAQARYGIRANAILPGLMNTPMAIEARVAAGTPRADVIAQRDARVPLGGKMGTAWDVAHAAAFLASDNAGFITGVALPVDGGASVRRG
jgi:NAD(P)-dependent dehydrogenase (short-subunit alcohol dehydrogenase family)